MNDVLLVAPAGIDDPDRPSGGNVYDRRIVAGLRGAGWSALVREAADVLGLARVLDGVPDGGLVIVDGLLGSAAPDVLTSAASRLRLVVLVHLPLGVETPARRPDEARALDAADAVVCASRWTRDWLALTYGLPAERLHVAVPGTEPAPLGAPSPTGDRILTIGALTPVKGHDVLVEALGRVAGLGWTATCVGSGDVDADFASRLRLHVAGRGLGDRIRWVGALTGPGLETAYADADVLVLPSRHETFGMVAAEALARGIPVIASEVGGVAEALGTSRDGVVPGLLVTPDDASALASALQAWLTDESLRAHLRAAALSRRRTLPGWPRTCRAIAEVLAATCTVHPGGPSSRLPRATRVHRALGVGPP